MSTFSYGKHTKKHIGVYLTEYNDDIMYLIKKSRNKRLTEGLVRIVVNKYDKNDDSVWLEVWCKSIFHFKHRYNVFYLKTKVNPEWSVDGNLGRGVNFK